MSRPSPRTLIAALALAAGVATFALGGCDSSCEQSCSDTYDDCMARSAPGASRAECSDAYSTCLDACSAQR